MHQILRVTFSPAGNMTEKWSEERCMYLCEARSDHHRTNARCSASCFPLLFQSGSLRDWHAIKITEALANTSGSSRRYPASAHVLSVRYQALSFHLVSLIYFHKTEYKCQSSFWAAFFRCTAAKSIIYKSLVYSLEPELSFVSEKVYVWHVRSVHGTIINVPVLLWAPGAPCLEAQCCNVWQTQSQRRE